jgi:hypothetical protein
MLSYYTFVHPPMWYNNTHPQSKSLNKCPASAFHLHNTNVSAGQLDAWFRYATEPAVEALTIWFGSGSQASCSSAIMFCSDFVPQYGVQCRISSRYHCCRWILIRSFIPDIWQLLFDVSKPLWVASAKNISLQAEWLRQSRCALSELSATPRW